MKKEEQQIDLIEEAFKQAHKAQPTPDIPEVWQSAVMASVQREVKAEAVVDRTETIMFRVSWTAAGIAAILVLMFGLFFNPVTDDSSIEDDVQNLYVDTVTNDMLTMNAQ